MRELWATFVLLTAWVQIPPPLPADGASGSPSVKTGWSHCLPGVVPGRCLGDASCSLPVLPTLGSELEVPVTQWSSGIL